MRGAQKITLPRKPGKGETFQPLIAIRCYAVFAGGSGRIIC
jgi:hypothetical protein